MYDLLCTGMKVINFFGEQRKMETLSLVETVLHLDQLFPRYRAMTNLIDSK